MNNTGFILFVIVDIIFLILVVIWLVRYQNKKIRSRTMKQFDDYVAARNLAIETKQTLNKNIIGLDRENMKIIFLDRKNRVKPIINIDFDEILSCKTITSRKTDNSHIKSISLEITYRNSQKERIILPFYHENNDKFYKMMRLAKKAYYWEKRINLFREMPVVV